MRRRVSFLAALATLVGCVEMVTQIGTEDVVEVLVSVDSAKVAIGRTLNLEALPLDGTGAFLSGLEVTWTSSDPAVADVDAAGRVTGVTTGTSRIVASVAGVADTATVAVAPLPALVLSDDSVRFTTSAGAGDPPPDSVTITNGGGFDLVGLSVDSVAYGPGPTGWLSAQLDRSNAPAQLVLGALTGDVTVSGTYRASAWLSGFDADNSPSVVSVVLDVTSGLADSFAVIEGDAQSAPVGTTLPLAPAVRVLDAVGNGVAGTGVSFAVAAGGGAASGASVITDGEGVARIGSWTLGTSAGNNNNLLTATITTGPLAGSAVTFVASAVAGAPATVTVLAGDAQTATVNTPVAIPPRAVVLDQYGNPVAGSLVTFTVTGGNGSVSPTAPVPADQDGEAVLSSWTLGTTAGTANNVLRVSAAGVATPAVITASATPGTASTVAIEDGDGQSATVGTDVPVDPRVVVRDGFGNPIAGHAVTFQVTAGGGTVQPATPVLTGPDGSLSADSWTLGTTAGSGNNALAATAAGVGGGVVFHASATADAAASIALVTGSGQTAIVGQTVAVDPQVRVRDQFGNPVGGHAVTFQVTGGGGSVQPTGTVTTEADGTATLSAWTLGTVAGSSNNTLTATAAGTGVTNNPIVFTASATADAAATVEVDAGAGQSATVGTALAIAPRVVVRDQFGNPVPGLAVTFQVTAGGGSVSPTTAIQTQPDGTATTSSWTLGTTSGTDNQVLTATAVGVTAPATFVASASPGVAARLSMSAGDGQSAAAGTAVAIPPRVVVLDQYDNPVPGQAVTFQVTGGGGTVLPVTPILTGSDGTATVTSWTLGQAAGVHTLSASVPTVATPATFTASATSSSAFSIVVSAGNNQSATVGTTVAIAPRVLVRDQFDNPVEGAAVTFAVTSGGTGAAVAPSTPVLTLADGTATLTSWTLGQSAGIGNNALSASVAGVATPAVFSASATAGTPASVIVDAGSPQSATVATAVGIAPRVLVRDQFGNPVQGASVTFAVTGGGTGAAVSPTSAITTGADGKATASSWTLGQTAGLSNNTLSASVPGVALPATFTASATAGAPFSVAVDAGAAQSATVATAVAVAPRVIVRDQYLNPVQGASVTFAVTAGGTGAAVVPTTAIASGTDGTATATSWTLGRAAGSGNNTLSATVPGVATPATFTASATPDVPFELVVAGGDGQAAVAGFAVGNPPSARVRDQFGNGVPGQGVVFTVTAGGGSVTGGTQTTGSDGVAAVTSWTLGPSPGPNSLRAVTAIIPDTVLFSATGIAGQAESMQPGVGDLQIDSVGATLAVAYTVRVLDGGGNGVPGVPVTWAVTGGGGSITPSSVTDALGVATAVRVLGTTAGTQTASASVGGLLGSPVSFSATANAGAPFTVTADAGDNQSATVATAVAVDPRVLVRDRFGNAVQNAAVTFAVTAGGTGAVVLPATAIGTGPDGRATAASWTLGQVAGTGNNTVSATVPGVATPAVFTASATAGNPQTVVVDAGAGQSATVGTAVGVRPRVLVRDQFLNPVQGASVTFAVTAGGTGAAVVPTTPVTTLSDGTATVASWTLGQTAGTGNNTLSASVPGVATPATFTASALTGAPFSVVVDAGNGQNATVATAVAVAPRVLVRDQFLNPVQGVSVTFAVTGGGTGAAVVPTTAIVTGVAGTATVTSWTLGQAAGTSNNTLSASVPGVATPATFTASATAGAPATVVVDAGNSQSAAVATPVAVAPRVLVRDQYLNPVANASVTFAVTGGGTGAAVVPTTPVTTGASGTATVTSWTLGQSAGVGNNTLSASVPGVATPAVFTASATAGNPQSVVVSLGNGQSATVATAVAVAPRVLVRDQFLNPVQNASVTFAVTAGGTGATVSPSTAIATLADGTATVSSWTLGQVAGTNNNMLSASVPGAPTPALFTASATAGAPQSVVVDLGGGQSATVATAVAVAPRVVVRDQYLNPVQGASVTFAVTAGGAGAAVVPTTAIVTGSGGTAAVTSWTLGQTAGVNNNALSASVPGVASPAVFTATATAGTPQSVIVDLGANQSATVATAVAIDPQVLVRDQYLNPVPNASVTFAVTAGGTGAAVVPTTAITTGSGGTATVTSWTLGQSAGLNNNTLSASVPGVATPAVFTATATAGAPQSVIVSLGNNQNATVATAVATDPQVLVRDQYLNPVPNASVTFAVIAGGTGAAVVPTTAITTLSDGTATVTSWTLGQTAGTNNNTLRATAAGVATPVNFTASATAGAPSTVIVDAGNNQSATVATAVAIDPRVLVRDQFDNPVPNASVTFAIIAGGTGAAVVPTTAIATLANGTATVTSWTLGQTAGTSNNTLRATVPGVGTPANFTASATAGAPASVSIVQGNNQTAVTGTNVSTTPTVLVVDQFSNPIAGRVVNFSASGSGSVGSSAPSTNASGQASTSWAVNVGGHSMATNGTYQNTLTATVSGTAISTSFTGYARYSFPTHVNPIWSMQGSGTTSTCLTCHGGVSGGTSGLSLGGSAAANHAVLVNVSPVCDDAAPLPTDYRRVRPPGGAVTTETAVSTYSIILRLVDPGLTSVGNCGDGGSHTTKMTATNLAILRAWIRNGAPSN
ncbi:MAG: Ig-like domain-containing protein [Gemmatimonadales bacterium]